jgi:hypothetical protein
VASAPVFSTRFFGLQEVAGSYTYTVPAGYRAVLRCVDLVQQGTSSNAFGLAVIGLGFIWYIDSATYSASVHFQWQGRQVLNPGEQLQADLPGLCTIFASGYLLSLS